MNDIPLYNEKELLLLASGGDRIAFTRLYAQYLDHLYKYIFLFTKSPETSEEIIQEVFISIWEHRERLAQVNSFQSYLFRAARNKAVDYTRRRQVEERVLAGYLSEKKETPETPGEAFDYKAYYHLVQEAIDKLPPRRQMIFRMNTEKGLSHDEIARELDISKSAVKNQLYEAYDFVRGYLSQNGEVSFALILTAFAAL
ncbi:MAG TPA: RNA polymerase sigma-70 factor [Puia sp.]|nr:RNA polymerase sigma-70 factor [Puia sp.]